MKTKFKRLHYSAFALMFFVVACQKELLNTKQTAITVDQSTRDGFGSYAYNPSISTPMQIFATHSLNEGGFLQMNFTSTYLGRYDSALIQLPYNLRNVVDTMRLKGDNDKNFYVKFSKNNPTQGKVKMNFNIETGDITLPFTVFPKRLGVPGTPDPYATGSEFKFCVVAVKVNGVWHHDSAWSDPFKLTGSKAKVELDSVSSPIWNDGSNSPSLLCKIRLRATGDWVEYDSFSVIINHYHAPVEANSFLLVDSVTSFTFGHAHIIKNIYGPYNNIAVLELILDQNGEPFKVDSGSVRTVGLLGVINKKDNNAWATIGMGDPAKMGWKDDTYSTTHKEFNVSKYFISNPIDYANNQVSLKWEF